MRFLKLFAFLLALLCSLSLMACSREELEPIGTTGSSNLAEQFQSPYQPMQAYILTADPTDALFGGDGFETEISFHHSDSLFHQDKSAVPDEKSMTVNGAEQVFKYRYSRNDPYSSRIYDAYVRSLGDGNSIECVFERGSDKIVQYAINYPDKSFLVGAVCSSEDEIIKAAERAAALYVDVDLSGWSARVRSFKYTSYSTHTVYFEQKTDGIVINNITVTIADSGKLRLLSTHKYRETISDIFIEQGTDEKNRSLITERIEQHVEELQAKNPSFQVPEIEIYSGTFYCDDEGLPYVVYPVDISYQYSLDYVEFLIYLE